MTRNRKIALLTAAGAALAIAGGGVAVAATEALSPEETSQAVIDDAAEQLGVEASELSGALRQALENRVDEAVDAGRLTEEEGDELKERIDSADTPLVFGGLGLRGFGHQGGFGHLGHVGHLGSLDTAATYLGVTEAELREALEDGKSLAEIAREEGKSVDGLVQALVADASERLDQAVEDGTLTRERSDEIQEELEERIEELVDREPGSGPGFLRPGFGHGMEYGFGRFHGDPALRGPRA